MAKKGLIGLTFGRCDVCGEENSPLTYYPPTKEWLDDVHLAERKRVGPAKKRIKSIEKENEFWDTIKASQTQ